MTPRLPLLTGALVLGIATTTLLAGCSGDDRPTPSGSESASASRTAGATPSTGSGSSSSPSAVPSDDQTGSADDGTGPGTGNGSGVETPERIDWSTITQQGIAVAGGGSVVSLAGAGDLWTVVVAGPDGSRTQAVVSATLGRVTSGPFPKDADAATKAADVARIAALRTDAAAAAAAATGSASGAQLVSLTLGGSGSAPVWTATLSEGGATKTVTVDGTTGAVAG